MIHTQPSLTYMYAWILLLLFSSLSFLTNLYFFTKNYPICTPYLNKNSIHFPSHLNFSFNSIDFNQTYNLNTEKKNPNTTDTFLKNKYSYTTINKLQTKVVMWIPTPMEWTHRRKIRTKSFIEDNYSPEFIHLIYFFGYKTGPSLEYNVDLSLIYEESKEYSNYSNIHYVYTACRDFGEEYNNANGTSSTTCKGYQAAKHAVKFYDFDYLWRGSEDAYINFKLFFNSVVPFLKTKKNVYLGCIRRSDLEGNPWDLYLSAQPELNKVWQLKEFGSYMSGMGFMLSWSVANLMDKWTIEPHQTWAEDVVFGHWLMPFQIERIHTNDYGWYCGHRDQWNPTNCNSQLIVHRMQDEDWTSRDSMGNLNFCK